MTEADLAVLKAFAAGPQSAYDAHHAAAAVARLLADVYELVEALFRAKEDAGDQRSIAAAAQAQLDYTAGLLRDAEVELTELKAELEFLKEQRVEQWRVRD